MEKLLLKTEIEELNIKSKEQLKKIQLQELDKLKAFMKEVYEAANKTPFITIRGFVQKYNAQPYYEVLKKNNVLVNKGSMPYPEWYWDSPKEPNNEMALATMKQAKNILFTGVLEKQLVNKNTRLALSQTVKDKEVYRLTPKYLEKIREINISEIEMAFSVAKELYLKGEVDMENCIDKSFSFVDKFTHEVQRRKQKDTILQQNLKTIVEFAFEKANHPLKLDEFKKLTAEAYYKMNCGVCNSEEINTIVKACEKQGFIFVDHSRGDVVYKNTA